MAEKKKPKPGPSTGGSSTSRIKRPKGSQPLTLGTGGLRTGKVSKAQQAGTRKVVGAIASATPVGKAASVATKAARNVTGKKPTNALGRKVRDTRINRMSKKYGWDDIYGYNNPFGKVSKTKPNPYNKAKDEVFSLDSAVRKNQRGGHGYSKMSDNHFTPTKKKTIRAYKASQKKK
jgi:hypothetical protein